MKDDKLWLIGIGAVIVISLLGGFKNTPKAGFNTGSFNTGTFPNQEQSNIQQGIYDAQRETQQIQQTIQAEEEKKIASPYKGQVSIRYVNRSTDPDNEYLVLYVSGATQPINITGWTLTSTSSGQSIKIPKSTYLFFAGQENPEQDVYVENGDTVYLNTGRSPNGYSFKVSKCSGYLEQFQNFNPGLTESCPRPRDEDLSSIPRTVINDACLDYISYFPQCRIQTETLPLNWSYECTNFIYTKINYPSCVNTHKNDSDFYQHEWRIYLKRSDHIWKNQRENITLYDNNGKVVDRLYY